MRSRAAFAGPGRQHGSAKHSFVRRNGGTRSAPPSEFRLNQSHPPRCKRFNLCRTRLNTRQQTSVAVIAAGEKSSAQADNDEPEHHDQPVAQKNTAAKQNRGIDFH